MALSTKQRVFVEEYMRCWNASEAARRAGYAEASARVQGHRLLTNAAVAAEIDRRLNSALRETDDELRTKLEAAIVADAPLYQKVQSAPDHVYIIRAANGLFKIGIAKNPAARLRALDTASPATLVLWATLHSESCSAIEREIHGLFAPYRVKGEWFSLSDPHLHWLVGHYGFIR